MAQQGQELPSITYQENMPPAPYSSPTSQRNNRRWAINDPCKYVALGGQNRVFNSIAHQSSRYFQRIVTCPVAPHIKVSLKASRDQGCLANEGQRKRDGRETFKKSQLSRLRASLLIIGQERSCWRVLCLNCVRKREQGMRERENAVGQRYTDNDAYPTYLAFSWTVYK